jgi:hypothetical protein
MNAVRNEKASKGKDRDPNEMFFFNESPLVRKVRLLDGSSCTFS